MTASPSPFAIRPAADQDIDEIVAVCGAALGWTNPAFDRALFEWKHIDNAFGRSLLLLAVDETAPPGSQIRAVRPFMRWRFVRPDGTTVSTARAVDTATLPQAQGKGLFRSLTLAGIDELTNEGCGFIFNTPNPLSLAGYLTMGWVEAGGVSLGFGLSSLKVAKRVAASRTAADKPSLPTPLLGQPVDEALSLLDQRTAPTASGLRTDHTVDTLRWRYSAGPIGYRFLRTGAASGIIVRLRKRGAIRELVVAQVLGLVDPRETGRHIRNAMQAVEADVCVAPPGLPKMLSVRRLSPTLALRPLGEPVDGSDFEWSPGDIELF